MALAALALHGFALAVLTGTRRNRILFVVGGAGLLLTHYVSSAILLGLGVGYLCFSGLRTRYAWKAFLTDVALQSGVVLVAMAQLSKLWRRRGELDWIGPPDFMLIVTVLGPFLLPILVAWRHGQRARDGVRHLIEWTFALAVFAQLGVMTVIAALGTNLLAPRYLMIVAVPAAVLGGLSLSRLRTPVASISAVFAIALVTTLSILSWRISGVPATLVHQDWREAVGVLDAELRMAPGAFVLYRPGFVEQDPRVPLSGALLAPLRSPGRPAPDWPVVPLTFSWGSAAREPHFRQVLVPALETAPVFFVLVSGTTPMTGDYVPLLVNWIETEFPNQFLRRPLGTFEGVDVLRFNRRTDAASDVVPASGAAR
jgi:hypothetical protein